MSGFKNQGMAANGLVPGAPLMVKQPEPQCADAGPTTSALETQIGGDHYKIMGIQPVEYIHANSLGFFEGVVVKYVSRWRRKNGLEDLRKAIHFLQLLIELETKHPSREVTDPMANAESNTSDPIPG